MDEPQTVSNVPEYTVSEISGAVKRTLETAFGRIRVKGEITELKRYPSGHIYFSLKDEAGKLSGVVWRHAVPRLGLVPENGVEVVAQGKISAYGERSSYQFIVDRMEYAGAGALLARIEALRAKLAAEGLFDEARKQPLPPLPDVVGVVTSEQGAVLQDIRTTIARRFGRRVLVWPVLVQGPEAAGQIAAAIAGFDAMPAGGEPPRPDVLIVARGGGSLEDLMAFNDEAVLRAVAACRIPLISAVGHETDTTLIDFVSDRRAPTPTAAAELAVPSRAELLADLAQKSVRLGGTFARVLEAWRLRVQGAARGLPDLRGVVAGFQQRLDDRGARLVGGMRGTLQARQNRLADYVRRLPDPVALVRAARVETADRARRLAVALPATVHLRRVALLQLTARLPHPERTVAPARAALTEAGRNLVRGLQTQVARKGLALDRASARLSPAQAQAAARQARLALAALTARLEAVSYQKTLERGFALVTTKRGKPVTEAAALKPASEIVLHFADGTAQARVSSPTVPSAQLPLL